ncbi:ubiquinone biosynthesis protein [Ideonella sp. BN130291]|uniref:ubiquinone biosynthesis protein n=1 Tax=Ideonella sp. BN130291 TaxID=3112940 RepID=UPI002E272F17|nr:ubiquinone biosynthesis protein [Ideonella sp. BN130291]
MGNFVDAVVGYPTAVYTALLGVVLVYWVLAMLGMVDFEAGGIDLDVDVHADAAVADLGTLASYAVAFGLNGVPFSVVISLLLLVSWTFSCLSGMWLLPLVPTAVLKAVAGTAVLLGSFVFSIPVVARVVRPLRGLFVTHAALSNAALVGQPCLVITQSVDEKVGRAEVAQRGAPINIRVWASSPNTLVRGTPARIVDYDPATGRYQIAADA